MAKTDIEATFCLLPVYPDSFRFLGCFRRMGFTLINVFPWEDFKHFSPFLEWVVKSESQLQSVLHYLSDFFVLFLYFFEG